jgi:putative ABC transport system permease protein
MDAGSGRLRAHTILVVAEVALCMVLLVGAGLLVRTLWLLHNINPGFDSHNVAAMDIPRPAASGSNNTNFMTHVLDRACVLPGVEAVAATSNTPLSGSNESTWSIQLEDQPPLHHSSMARHSRAASESSTG